MNKPRHLTVYHDPGMYAGWPANQGMWIWDNEILVGFVRGFHAKERGDWKYGHPIDQTRMQEHVYARSMDGGETWGVPESGEFCGRSVATCDHTVEVDKSKLPVELAGPIGFISRDFTLSFARVTNQRGPTHFYWSWNRGREWSMPLSFPDLGSAGVASRTDYIVLGRRELLAMLTVAKPDGREGMVLCARTEDGGLSWEALGLVSEPMNGFSIMPSTVRLVDDCLLSVVRRCEKDGIQNRHWLDACLSEDIGHSWRLIGQPVEDTGHSGGPGSLVKLADGRLLLAYVVRGREYKLSKSVPSRLCVKLSEDGGFVWSPEIVLREDGVEWDLGYPRVVQRPDGKVVITYYWVNQEWYPDRWIGATIWEP